MAIFGKIEKIIRDYIKLYRGLHGRYMGVVPHMGSPTPRGGGRAVDPDEFSNL